jgi:hypothetical protein
MSLVTKQSVLQQSGSISDPKSERTTPYLENPVRELARRYHSEVVMTISRTVAALIAMNEGHRSKNIPADCLW